MTMSWLFRVTSGTIPTQHLPITALLFVLHPRLVEASEISAKTSFTCGSTDRATQRTVRLNGLVNVALSHQDLPVT